MGMPTAVNQLKKKLEKEAGVQFEKLDQNNYRALMDGNPLTDNQRTLSQAVWLAARQLGEEA